MMPDKPINEVILDALEREDFFQWHENDFKEYVEGGDGCKTKEEILKDIDWLFLKKR